MITAGDRWKRLAQEKRSRGGRGFENQDPWTPPSRKEAMRRLNCKTASFRLGETYPSIRTPVSKCSRAQTMGWLADSVEADGCGRPHEMNNNEILQLWHQAPHKDTLGYYGVGSNESEAELFDRQLTQSLAMANGTKLPRKQSEIETIPSVDKKKKSLSACQPLVLNREAIKENIQKMPIIKKYLSPQHALTTLYCNKPLDPADPFGVTQEEQQQQQPEVEKKHRQFKKKYPYCDWSCDQPKNMCTDYEWRKYKEDPRPYDEALKLDLELEQEAALQQAQEPEPRNYEELYYRLVACFEALQLENPLCKLYSKCCIPRRPHDEAPGGGSKPEDGGNTGYGDGGGVEDGDNTGGKPGYGDKYGEKPGYGGKHGGKPGYGDKHGGKPDDGDNYGGKTGDGDNPEGKPGDGDKSGGKPGFGDKSGGKPGEPGDGTKTSKKDKPNESVDKWGDKEKKKEDKGKEIPPKQPMNSDKGKRPDEKDKTETDRPLDPPLEDKPYDPLSEPNPPTQPCPSNDPLCSETKDPEVPPIASKEKPPQGPDFPQKEIEDQGPPGDKGDPEPVEGCQSEKAKCPPCPCTICVFLKRHKMPDSPMINNMKRQDKIRQLREYYKQMLHREYMKCRKTEYRAPQRKCDPIVCDNTFCSNPKLGEYCECLQAMRDLQHLLGKKHKIVGNQLLFDLENLRNRIRMQMCNCL